MTPDLTVLGKIIGGGLPAAAYAGRRELMERIAPAGDVYQAGTLSGNPLATAAGLATLRAARRRRLRVARPRPRERSRRASRRRRRTLGSPRASPATTGLLTLFFAERPPRNYEEARACDLEAHAAFCRAMLDRGIYLPPSQFEAWFPSLAHGDAHVERTLDAAREALGDAVSRLAELIEAADPALAAYAVARARAPGASTSATGRRRLRARGRLRGLPPALRRAARVHRHGRRPAPARRRRPVRARPGPARGERRPGGGGRAVGPDLRALHRRRRRAGRRTPRRSGRRVRTPSWGCRPQAAAIGSRVRPAGTRSCAP